ncbi:J domain-containing protein [Leadbettera azotonutricia]|uniref:DnaJ domain protein n=1 Tax=Leadbettera azotonutricia (strain ATCC BAA-888 / DSM 13862 / ZAS-9) TaxID=545695 RepID=F5YDR5_LEAAZ|nr:J domain-containing protein [Leadbettera azotonutricia]AEF80194.1 DnaJ domain protein [Leadbettera azotonutricia ZAS-9]
MGGVAGFIIGAVLGYFVHELLGQLHSDKAALGYYENPGRPGFYEGEPGLAAYCALAMLILEESLDKSGNGEAEIEQAVRLAKASFPLADFPLVEHFCRLAWSKRESLNPDLLAESLAARRKNREDLPELGTFLFRLASCEKAQTLAGEICSILDPHFKRRPGAKQPSSPDPWKILDLPPDTPLGEVKSHYRKLATQFHPDALQALDEEHRETAARAFMAIKEAYKEIAERY